MLLPSGGLAGIARRRSRNTTCRPRVLLVFHFGQAHMAPSPLGYVPVPEAFKLPPGANFGGTSGVAFNSKGNIFVIHRGPMPLMEFDPDGTFVRGWGAGLFARPHGLRVGQGADIWETAV